MRSLTGLASALFVLLALAPAQGQEKDKEALEKALARRYPVIKVLKRKGELGESWKGYIAGVKSTDLEQEVDVGKERMTLAKLIEVENADREALYTIIAKERSESGKPVTAEYVGKRSGKEQLKRLKPGEWFLKKGDKWIQKPRRR
jgi:uncharacterized protein YdbL (DUF1318 family)